MLILICCVDQRSGIGKNNKIPWSNKEEMLFFKNTTINHKVVMGYNTYLSLNKKPLINRTNIVLSREKKEINNGFVLINDYKEIINLAKKEDIFIIGGEQIYKLFENYYDKLIINYLDQDYDCDRFLKIDFSKFKLVDSKKINDFQNKIFIRKNK